MVTPSAALARALVSGLVASGVHEVVLCAGSRSAPLAYALHSAEWAGLLRLHVRHDERSAAFVALGVGRLGDGSLAAVVTTSGTAVANLLPAAMEAHEAGVPLLMITADRPAELRGTWANQTSDRQPRLLHAVTRLAVTTGDAAPASARAPGADIAAEARRALAKCMDAARGTSGGRPGPVHLDVAFADPLVPDDAWNPPPTTAPTSPGGRRRRAGTPVPVILDGAARTVVVAGDLAGERARALAEGAGWPLLAEPSSGARSGPNAISAHRLLVAGAAPELLRDVERVVAFGRPTLSRSVTALLARADIELVRVVDHPDQPGPSPRRRMRRLPAVAAAAGVSVEEQEWLAEWQVAGTEAHRAVSSVLDAWAAAGELTGPTVAREVAAASEVDDVLVLGASSAVRDVDLAALPWPITHPRAVLSGRGVSGIDGTVSTASGAAIASGAPTRVLVGDLAFLHDLNGLLLPVGEHEPALLVVVVDDDGGGIFSTLEHGEPERAATFERLFGTPHGSDIAALCRGYRVPYQQVSDLASLRSALRRVRPGRSVVHVRVDRAALRGLHEQLAGAAAAAVAGLEDEELDEDDAASAP